MVVAWIILGALFYFTMMCFSAIFASMNKANTAVDKAWMIVFWPIWVGMEARHGDPFLVTAITLFISYVIISGLAFL